MFEKIQNVPKWVRGKESLTMLSPRPFPSPIPLIGLGKSIGGNVTAEVVIFHSFEELEKNSKLAEGKIVFFNIQLPRTYSEVTSPRPTPIIDPMMAKAPTNTFKPIALATPVPDFK